MFFAASLRAAWVCIKCCSNRCNTAKLFGTPYSLLFLAFILCVPISAATRDESLCVIANPAFVVYSSIVSFYVPFIITLLVYVQIYVVLRKRRKRVNTKPKHRVCQATEPDVATSLKVTPRQEMPGFTLRRKKMLCANVFFFFLQYLKWPKGQICQCS